MFSLKIDYVKENGRQLLATSVQYAENENLILQPLAVKQVSGLDDELLKSQVKRVLPRYDANDSHLYSIRTKVGKKALRRVCGRRKAEDEDQGSRSVDPDRGDFACKADGSPSDKSEVAQVLDEDDEFVEVGGCIMHALELAVSEALKEPSTCSTIEKCREISNKLSVRSVMEQIKQRKLKPPVNDSSKKLVPTFKMLTRLLELKDFAADFVPKEDSESPRENIWENVKNITASLQPAQVFMNTLLAEQLTIGDFYGAWLKCFLDTSSIGSPLAQALVESMKSRERNFFDTNTFCAALYMDPRYRIVLTPEQKCTAITHLTKTWKRIAGINQKQKDSKATEVSSSAAAPGKPVSVNEYLSKIEAKNGKNHNVSAKLDTNAIERWLKLLDEEPHAPAEQNVLEYWKQRKQFQPQLYALALVVLGVPVTEESEKHAMSALRIISFYERSQISSGTLDDLLLLTFCS